MTPTAAVLFPSSHPTHSQAQVAAARVYDTSVHPVRGILLGSLMALCATAAEYELIGQIVPEIQSSLSLHGATAPFQSATVSDARGRFRFRKLAPGAYTVLVFEPERGEARRTVEIGPGVADSKGRVTVTLRLDPSKFDSDDTRRRHEMVSARELSIPSTARREYEDAQKRLSRRDVNAAITHLQRAVEVAPQYSAAWNQLGAIAYQTRKYPDAEKYFRRSLAADPQAFEPLVNLGGVLLNLEMPDEALQHNRHAVLRRPKDALANSQLGMSYFLTGNLDAAVKYLTIAKQLDPAHFSHPQLLLSEIHLKRNEREAAIAELEDFVTRHPDSPEATQVKATLARLRP